MHSAVRFSNLTQYRIGGTVATTPFIARTDRDTLQAIADLTVKPPDGLAETAETGDNEDDTQTEDPR